MSPKDLEKLMKLCRKHGVKALKTAQVELSFDEGITPEKTYKPKGGQASPPIDPITEEPSSEEVLFYSAPDLTQGN